MTVVEKVPMEVGKLIAQGRMAKSITQKELATVGSEDINVLWYSLPFENCNWLAVSLFNMN